MTDHNDTPKRYPANKSLQLKAGTGSINKQKVNDLSGYDEKQSDKFTQILRTLSHDYNKLINELSALSDEESFTSGPEKQMIIDEIIKTLMDIKANIHYSHASKLTEFASIMLEAIDSNAVVDLEFVNHLRVFSVYVENHLNDPKQVIDGEKVDRLIEYWAKKVKR